MSRDNDQKRKKSPYMEISLDKDQKYAHISNEMQLQNHSLAFIHKNKSLPSATSKLSRSPMAHNTTASLYKLTCADYVDFDKCQDRFGQFFWFKNDSNYLDVKLKFIKKDDNREFQLVQNLTICETNFNHFMRVRNQLVIAADKYVREKNMSSVVIPTLSKTWMNNSNWFTRGLT